MRASLFLITPILTSITVAQLVILPYDRSRDISPQQPLMDVSGPGPALPPNQPSDHNDSPPKGGVMLSDVMGRDRSINIFAGFARDVELISKRLDDAKLNSTVLAPLNSAIDGLPRKPWEDAKDYEALGANAYEGDDGVDRAHRNLRKFVEAHLVPESPWQEGKKIRSLLDGDREVWWEKKGDGKVLKPDGIEVVSVGSQVGNGEIWILKGVRNYA